MSKFEKVDRAVILMAGKGTRFLPATKATPKELFPIANKPALLYHLQECLRSGIKKVCLVISKEKEFVKEFLSHNEELENQLKNTNKMYLLEELNEVIDNLDISYVYQGDMNGSGGAVYAAKEWTEGKPFALFYADDLCKNDNSPAIGQVAEAFEQVGKNVIGARPFPMEVIHRYSSIIKGEKLFDNCHKMKDIIEKPEKGKAPSNLVGLGRNILTSEIFDEILKCPKFANGEIRLTDAIQMLALQGKAVCYEFDAEYYDCGNKLEYIKCIIDFALNDKEIAEDLKAFMKTKSE